MAGGGGGFFSFFFSFLLFFCFCFFVFLRICNLFLFLLFFDWLLMLLTVRLGFDICKQLQTVFQTGKKAQTSFIVQQKLTYTNDSNNLTSFFLTSSRSLCGKKNRT